MHSSDILKFAEIGVNIEISKDSRLHISDALKIVKIVTSRGNHVTIKKGYHPSDMMKMAEIGRENLTISV